MHYIPEVRVQGECGCWRAVWSGCSNNGWPDQPALRLTARPPRPLAPGQVRGVEEAPPDEHEDESLKAFHRLEQHLST